MNSEDIRIGPPIIPHDNFGRGPLTREDLEDYKRRLGERCPTPQDAMRHADLAMRLQANLRDTDYKAYNESILQLKRVQTGNGDDSASISLKQKIQALEQKALSRNQDGRAKIEKKREKKDYLNRVRVKDNGKKGTVGWQFVQSSSRDLTFDIHFDDGSTNDADHRYYSKEEVTMLCDVCDEDAGSRCSRCEKVYYCGRECQRLDWKTHKKTCNK